MSQAARPSFRPVIAAFRWFQGLDGARARLAALALGLMLPLAFAPFFVLPALVICFTGFVWLLDGAPRGRQAFWLGWWFGFGQFLTGLFWIAEAFARRDGVTYELGVLAVVGLALGLAFYPALAAWAARLFRARGIGRVFAFAACWSIAEWLRGHLLTGFPWNLNAYALAANDALMQGAAYVGAYGLSFAATFLAALPAALLSAPGAAPRWRWTPPFYALAGFALLLALGGLRLAGDPRASVPDLKLLLVQANIPQEKKWSPALVSDHFFKHLEMSRRALAAAALPSSTKLAVIWPETAVAYPLNAQPSRRYLISKALDGYPGVVITGAPRVITNEDNGGRRYWNSAFVIGGGGTVLESYDKAHLVPFGEYMPLRSLAEALDISHFVEGSTDFSAGPGPRSLHLPAETGLPPFSPLICYEVIFPGAAADPGDRPAWLLNLSNDAWYGTSSGPYQHFAAARFRAIEEGAPLVRATGTGISAIIDPMGRVLSQIGLDKSGVLIENLPRALPTATGYSKGGDIFYALILAALVFLYRSRRGSRLA